MDGNLLGKIPLKSHSYPILTFWCCNAVMEMTVCLTTCVFLVSRFHSSFEPLCVIALTAALFSCLLTVEQPEMSFICFTFTGNTFPSAWKRVGWRLHLAKPGKLCANVVPWSWTGVHREHCRAQNSQSTTCHFFLFFFFSPQLTFISTMNSFM